jgi:hypothetical protein
MRFTFYLCQGLHSVWTTHFWVYGIIPVVATWAILNVIVAALLTIALALGAQYWTGMSITSGFTIPVRNDDGTSYTPPRKTCHHVDPCECFDERDRDFGIMQQQLAETNRTLYAIQIERDRVEAELEQTRTELEICNNRPSRMIPQYLSNIPTMGAMVAAPPYERMLSDFEHARRRVVELEQERDNWILEKNNLILSYNTELVKWKEQVNYAQGAGDNMLVARTEIDDLKAKVRTLQRDNQALIEAGMQTRQALAAERELHSEKCQDEAGCQTKISALQYRCKQLLNSHAYNDKMVVDAAIKFGMPKEDAQHIDLMAYLRAVTIELARLKALGVQGLGATNTADFAAKQLQDENSRLTALKNRLEREVDRLGGDVMGIRNGWDTTKPKNWSIDMNLTYEENAYRMFLIYERLCEALFVLESTLKNANQPLPQWEPEVPRNDKTHGDVYGFVVTPQYLLEANKKNNRMILSSEDLTQKLTVNEVQRLYNRALQLAVRIKELSPKERVNGEDVVKNPVIGDMLHLSDRVFKDVLVNILDDCRPVITSPTEQHPDPRMQKKFEIYTAMQETIQALTTSIVADGHAPPQWMNIQVQQNKSWTSPDNLALNLINAEMRILEMRINQLLQTMTQLRLPGTLHGTPLIVPPPDPSYNARWYELVASTTYSRLVLSHWKLHLDQREVQVQDEKGELKTIIAPVSNLLPLTNKDRYFRAVLNRGESEKEKAAREIKEGKWPHPDAVQSTILPHPVFGPQIEFMVLDPNAKKVDYSNNGNISYKQDEDNSNPSDNNGKSSDYEKAKKFWETKRRRIEQLKNHINYWNIRGDYALPGIPNQLRKNMDVEDVKRANNRMDGQIGEMTRHITQAGYQVPRMVHKGGPMHPKSS